MPASEFRKKTAIFVLFAGIIVLLIVVLVPLFEDRLKLYVLQEFGITVTQAGDLVPRDGDLSRNRMVETSISLVLNLVRIVTIALWMTLIIAVVRFVGYAIVSKIRGSQSDLSSLIKTVLSII